MPVDTAPRYASDKQVAFITRLLGEKALPDGHADLTADIMTTAQASTYIDYLMRLPRKAAAHADGDAMTTGMYVLDGKVYKVQASRQSGNLYAKVLIQDDAASVGWWSYAPGAIRDLVNGRRLTVDEAVAYGRATGSCMVCSRTLTDPDSIAAGIGPVCASRLA